MSSNHGRRPLARPALAAGGIGALVAVAALAHLAAGAFGLLAGIALAGGVFAACWYVVRVRPALRAARPAPVRLPVPAADLPEPTRTAA